MKKSANEGEKTDMKLRNSLLLLLTATIWGVAFVAQSVGMDYVGPFTFVFARNVIGGLVLLPDVYKRQVCSHVETYSQCQTAFCYTYWLLLASAAQGELPEGQERVPWGITVPHNS